MAVVAIMRTFAVVSIAKDIATDYAQLFLHTACVIEIQKKG